MLTEDEMIKTREEQCPDCQGAGLVNDFSNMRNWQCKLCATCNGVGVILVTKGNTVDTFTAYDVPKSIRDRMGRI